LCFTKWLSYNSYWYTIHTYSILYTYFRIYIHYTLPSTLYWHIAARLIKFFMFCVCIILLCSILWKRKPLFFRIVTAEVMMITGGFSLKLFVVQIRRLKRLIIAKYDEIRRILLKVSGWLGSSDWLYLFGHPWIRQYH